MTLKYDAFTLNRCLVFGTNLVIIMNVGVILHFEPSALRCEITVMPLDWISGRDNPLEGYDPWNDRIPH